MVWRGSVACGGGWKEGKEKRGCLNGAINIFSFEYIYVSPHISE